MATKVSPAVKPHKASKQFTLRQAAIWTVWISIGLALLSQIGTSWGFVLWLTAGAAVLGYAAWRGWVGWIAMSFLGVWLVLYLISTPRY